MELRTWMAFVSIFVFTSITQAQAETPKAPAAKEAKKLPSKPAVAEQADEVVPPSEGGKPHTKRPPLDPSKVVRIVYTNSAWNTDSTRIDGATVILRDSQSGRTVQVQLNETGPDSGEFAGYYSITWGSSTEVQPEIYVPTRPIKDGQAVATQFELKKMRRLPFILRRGEHDEQLIQMYNTRDEAMKALDALKANAEENQPQSEAVAESLKAAAAAKRAQEESAAKALLEAAEMAKVMAQKKKESEEAQAREAERAKMQELEKKKAEQLMKQQAAVSAAEKARRKKLAQESADHAMELFRSGQFVPAEEEFKKAHELDPENTSFYFGYGVTLYRNGKNNDSLVILGLANKGDFNPAEKDFFMGLNYLKLKEYRQALTSFQKAKASKHPQIAPSAAFYEGVVHFTELRYEQAKVAFQEVLDTSNDPKLDESADDYIEKIERILYYIKNKEKKLFLSLNTGLQYDSNVLLVNTSDTSTGSATDVADTRTILGAGVEYRPIYDKEKEFSAKLRTDMMFSQKSTNVSADPFQYSLKLPYKSKGMLWGKGYQMELVPGYEVLKLDVDASGANKSFFAALPDKETYLNSYTLDWNNTRVMSDDYFTGYNFKFRSDNVGSDAGAGATGDNDPSAFKVAFDWNNMWFKNKKKTEALITDSGVTINSGKGKSLSYNRIDLGGTYVFPWVWELSAVANVAAYYAMYSQRDPSRQDLDLAASFNVVKTLNEWLKATAGLGYTNNSSNITASSYNKYTATLLLSGDWSF